MNKISFLSRKLLTIFFIVAFSISTFYGYKDSSYLVEAASEGQNPFDEVSSPSDSIPISEALLSDGEVDSGALPHGISLSLPEAHEIPAARNYHKDRRDW